jgi:acetyltransferase
MKLEAFLRPRSIAVIGASREPNKVGHRVFRNIVESGFQGALYPVNPKADEILGHRCYRDVSEIQGEVDLAVIAVPAKLVPAVAEGCGRKGVKGLVVISAGFSETGGEGVKLERELVSVCRKYGMRLQGPNCLGIVDTQGRMNASFVGAHPLPGSITLISQSGALGSSILNWALQNKVGLTSFISIGNEADLKATDFMEALADDERTRVIGLYIEGVKDGQRFIKVAKEITRKKPVVVLKSGTTEAGIRAVSSHTGSMSGSDTVFSAACRKASILRVDTLEELFDLVRAFGAQPAFRGKEILIITNGGGPGVLAADACERLGLELPPLEYDITEKLREAMPPHASVYNPIDIVGDADEKRYRTALEMGLSSRKVGGVIVIVTPQAMTPVDRIAEVVAEARRRFPDRPILPVFMGVGGDSWAIKTLNGCNLPNYEFPESAAFVLRRMHDYSSSLEIREEETPVITGVDEDLVSSIIFKARSEGRVNLMIEESLKIANACSIPTPRSMVARSIEEAVEIADSIGYPVAMKVISPKVVHKTDVGGVVLNVKTGGDVRANYEAMLKRMRAAIPGEKVTGVLISRMAPAGKEVIIGAVRDLQFGPLMMFGLGGVYVNFLRDVAYRLCPLTGTEAREMMEETKAYTLLRGVRGEPPSDINSVVDVILRMSQLMTCFEEIVEMEVNPLFVYEEGKGCIVVDIRMTISQ